MKCFSGIIKRYLPKQTNKQRIAIQMADILTPEEEEYFKTTLSMYMAIAKNKNVELSPQLRLENMIKMFELYLSEVGRVFLNQPLAKNMRSIILTPFNI